LYLQPVTNSVSEATVRTEKRIRNVFFIKIKVKVNY